MTGAQRAAAMMAALPLGEVALSERGRDMALILAQQAHREMRPRASKIAKLAMRAGERDHDERRVERDRREGIDGEAADAAVLEHRGHHRDAGREQAERVAELAGAETHGVGTGEGVILAPLSRPGSGGSAVWADTPIAVRANQ